MAVDLSSVRERLESEQQRITGEITALEERAREEQTPGEAAFGNGDQLNDDAALAVEREKEQALRNSMRAVLTDVQGALLKLERGTYGTCEHCGEPINPRRLEALPHATLCIRCKSLTEQRRF